MVRRMLVRLGGGALVLAALMAGGLGYLYLTDRGAPAPSHRSAGPNGVWAGHAWVGEPRDGRDYARLAEELGRRRISDAFFHVGPIAGDGTIPTDRHPHAAALVDALEVHNPRLRLLAWMGQIEKRGGGPLDLSDPSVRANIVRTAARFLDLGFDGIHYNFEPTASGSPDLLALLDETAAMTRAQGKLLSMATDELEPVPGLAWIAGLLRLRGGFWSADYYREVARRVDQIAVMMYDTALPTDWLYASLVAWETRAIVELVGEQTIVFMGVPTYEEQRLSFHPEAENMVSALRGIQRGLRAARPTRPERFGVAVYALWTTDQKEWAHYRRAWLGGAAGDGP